MSEQFVIAQSYLEEVSETNEVRVFNPATATEAEFREFIVALFIEHKKEKTELNMRIEQQDKEIANLRTKLNSLEKDNNSAFEFKDKEIDELKVKNESLKKEIADYKDSVRTLKGECKSNYERCVDLERHSRGFNLRFPKIPEVPKGQSEDCISILKEKLSKVGLGHVHIENAHRTGAETFDPNRPRAIIARFCYRPERRAVLKAKNELFKHNVPVFEDLVKSDLQIKMKYASAIKKHYESGKRVWFAKGFYYINGIKQEDMV